RDRRLAAPRRAVGRRSRASARLPPSAGRSSPATRSEAAGLGFLAVQEGTAVGEAVAPARALETPPNESVRPVGATSGERQATNPKPARLASISSAPIAE